MAEQLSAISCLRCRGRKVRCSRHIPKCDLCKRYENACVYPPRMPRKTTKSSASHLLTTGITLPSIVRRLQRLEQIGENSLSDNHISLLAPSTALPLRNIQGNQHLLSELNDFTTAPTPLPRIVHTPPRETSSKSTSIFDDDVSALDALTVLSASFDEVRCRILKDVTRATIDESINIPSDAARTWIQNYFKCVPTVIFESFVSRKLIEAIPDVIDSEHVHLDPSLLVVYHCMLYQGCVLEASNMDAPQGYKYARSVYLCCLRSLPAWFREATGSTTDFLGALLMTRVAAEFFDLELSWKIHGYACQFAQSLNLDKLDSTTFTTTSSTDRTSCLESKRQCFWQLIHLDLFFQLALDKPSIIVSTSWSVNLPTFVGSVEQAVPILTFVVESRVTFIQMKFLELIREHAGMSIETMDTIHKVDALCQETQNLYEEWCLGEWNDTSLYGEFECWKIAESIFSIFTSIIFMTRRLDRFLNNIPHLIDGHQSLPLLALRLRASRHILSKANDLLRRYSSPIALCALWAPNQCYVAYAYLYNHLNCYVDGGDTYERSQALADAQLLNQTLEVCETAAGMSHEIMPFIRTLRILDEQIRGHVRFLSRQD